MNEDAWVGLALGEVLSFEPINKCALETAAGLNEAVKRFLKTPEDLAAVLVGSAFAGGREGVYELVGLEASLEIGGGEVPAADEKVLSSGKGGEEAERGGSQRLAPWVPRRILVRSCQGCSQCRSYLSLHLSSVCTQIVYWYTYQYAYCPRAPAL